ncbi:MAG: hypothetical protein HUJ53_05700 [Holdemanella sp.]|nr:hypothetical protein [Holdemanella sp.]
MDRLKSFLKEEREKIKKIPGFIPKIEYIWEYYWILIVGVIFVVFFMSFSVNQYFNSVKDYWFYVTFTNTNADVGTDSELYNKFVDYCNFDLSEKKVEFNNVAFFDYGNNETGNSYFESFIAYTDAGTLDCVTMPVDSMELLGKSGRLLDLNRDECKNIKAKYGDRFIYSVPFDEEYSKDPVPIGIDISDSCLMKKYNIYTDSCAIGIGANTQHIETIERFLEFIFEE